MQVDEQKKTTTRKGRGGDRGGRRPSAWKGCGVPSSKCKGFFLPAHLKRDVVRFAHWLDEGKIRMDQVEAIVLGGGHDL